MRPLFVRERHVVADVSSSFVVRQGRCRETKQAPRDEVAAPSVPPCASGIWDRMQPPCEVEAGGQCGSVHWVSAAHEYLARLSMASDREALSSALWDLRDLAYDEPELWGRFTAEVLFQGLAEQVDAARDDAIEWSAFRDLLSAVLGRSTWWLDQS